MKTIFIPMQLKCARQRNKKTLKDVSQDTGISIGQLSDIERGRTLPSIPTMITLTDYYEIPVEQLFATFEDVDR